ncbi:PAQR family membrane homeostasis protein TrhA [Oceanibacterium hippocampi]|uniref:Hemolysin-III related n=1 Tax=Oceanibacterium hippocampi TaxID=745714 RepID=A0A1Y5TQE9_9PROT|nr:hemolysin III family protein [Oceanibacterium hippocampi]SLN69441.1 hemolysin-III related [Oceanibacterium hippocampi]
MFPDYSRSERLIDGLIHGLGVLLAVVAVPVLLAVAADGATRDFVTAAIYGAGLLAMLGFSAAYNLVSDPLWKGVLRRCDHAAIYLMIAGTYTPFSLVALGGWVGWALLALVWAVALAGALFKLAGPGSLDRASVTIYLALGWIGLPAAFMLVSVLPVTTLVLLGLGGLLYTAGVAFHLWERLPHHNAIWHAFVLGAAACHYAAVFLMLDGAGPA